LLFKMFCFKFPVWSFALKEVVDYEEHWA
jgi:hypothetical protein